MGSPDRPRAAGELLFQFEDGLKLHCAIFRAYHSSGEPRETNEAIPLWTPTDRIPYEAMGEEDRHWVPLLVAGKYFRGCFQFDGDRMLAHKVEMLDRADFRGRSPEITN